MAGEKKTWGFFVLFAVILLWYFFIIQRATAFIIQMFSTIISALALSPLAWITLLRHLWVLHGVAENQPRPDLTGYWNWAEWTLVRGDTQNGITPNQFHLTVVQTNKKQSYVFVYKVDTYNAESTKERNQLNRIFLSVVFKGFLWRTKRGRRA